MKIDQDEMLRRYINDIEQYPLITIEEEKKLSDIIHDPSSAQEDKDKAKERLILSNLLLVVKIAIEKHSSIYFAKDANLSLMDLIQAGNIELMRLAESFLSSKNCKFSSYAYPSIEGKMMRAIKASRFIRLPPDHYKYLREIDEIEEQYDSEVSDSYLAKRIGIQLSTVKMLKRNRHPKVSIDEVAEMLEHYGDNSGEEEMNKKQIREYVFTKIKELNPRQREALTLMFFSNQIVTMEYVGNKMGISRERVRQLLIYGTKSLRAKIQFQMRGESKKMQKGSKK